MSAILKQKLIDIANGFTKYGLWKGGGSRALSEMTDVTFTDLQTNDVLTYNGSKWVNDDNLQTQIDTLNNNFSESIKVTDSSGNVYGTLIIETCGKIAQVTFMSDNAQTQGIVTSINKVSKLPKTYVYILLFSISDAEVCGYITIGKDGTVSILKSYNWVYGSNAYVIV